MSGWRAAPGRRIGKLALAGALAFACSGRAEPGEVQRFNLVVALVDTLRADHLGVYGYARATSPHIDAFAAQSVFFSEARSQAPCTFPSVNSLLTSRDPARFHGQERGRLGIPERFVTLPEILRTHGYRTAAVSASPVVRRSPAPHNKEGGFGRGFEAFDERCFRKEAACVNQAAFELLDALQEPFFLYLHYLEPHGPYQPPASYPRRFAGPYAGKDFVARGDPKPIAEMLYKDGPKLDLTPADLQHLIDLYDEEIRYFDGEFQRLIDELERRGLWQRTILVLLSDHGEDFLEHDDIKHCRNLYESQIKTPLLLRVPGLEGRRIAENVQNLDVTPTLLELVGIDPGAHALDGTSLLGAIRGAASAGSPASASWRSLRSIVDGRYKLVLDLRSGAAELYDLRRDPDEREDLADRLPEERARLVGLLEAHLARHEPDRANALARGDETLRQLRALGYLE